MSFFVVLVAACLTAKKNAYGIGVFIFTRILIPEVVRMPVGFLSLNSGVIIAVLIVVLVKERTHLTKPLTKPNKHVCIVTIMLLYAFITLPLADTGSLLAQYRLLVQFVLTELMPSILLVYIIRNECDISVVVRSLLIATTISCAYGVLSFFLGCNPYVDFFKSMSTAYKHINADVVDNSWRGVGTSATFISSNSFGYYITMMVPFFVYMSERSLWKKHARLNVVLLVVCAVLCKKRTPIIALLLFLLGYTLFGGIKYKTRLMCKVWLVVLMSVVTILTAPSLDGARNVLYSSVMFWNDQALPGLTRAQLGSSMWLRINQMLYPFKEIKDNLLFGHGFGWCRWFLDKYELHPIMYGFETILSTSVCEFGVFGYFVYSFLFYGSYRFAHEHNDMKIDIVLLFIFTVVIMTIASGFNYYYLFFLLVALMNRVGKHYDDLTSVNYEAKVK